MVQFLRHPSYTELSFEPHDPPASQVLFRDPADDLPYRETKRRRIEELGQRYLKGHTLHIQSALLKGPFGHDWNNPWRPRAQSAKADRRAKRRQLQKQREEIAAELQRDGLGRTPARPVDLTEETQDAEIDTAAAPAATTYCHEWLKRRDFARKTSGPSSEHVSAFKEPLTPSKPSRPRPIGKVIDVLRKPVVAPQGSGHTSPSTTEFSSLVKSTRPVRPDATSDLSSGKPTEGKERKQSNLPPSLDMYSKLSAPESPVECAEEVVAKQRPTTELNVTDNGMDSNPQQQKSMPLSLQVNFDEGTAQELSIEDDEDGRNSSKTLGPSQMHMEHHTTNAQIDMAVCMPNKLSTYSSGFTAINQRRYSSLASPKNMVGENTASSRLDVETDPTRPSVDTVFIENGIYRAKSGTERLSPAGVLSSSGQENKPFQGHENGKTLKTDDQARKLRKQVLLQSAERLALETLEEKDTIKRNPLETKTKKQRQYLNASPAVSSPGFAYRKVSGPTQMSPEFVQTDNMGVKPTTEKKEPRRITFESPSEHGPALVAHDQSTEAEPAVIDVPESRPGAMGSIQPDVNQDKPAAAEDQNISFYVSSTRDLSTQAAMMLAQEAFQNELISPVKETSIVISTLHPEQTEVAERRDNRATMPPSSQPVEEFTAITPFKEFNKGRQSPAGDPARTGPVSTQDLFNAASPFDFSTVKKEKTGKRVNLADPSPSKLTSVTAPKGNQDINHSGGAPGLDSARECFAGPRQDDIAIANEWSATELATPAPLKSTTSSGQLPSGLKSRSLNLALSQRLALGSHLDSNQTPLTSNYEYNTYTIPPESEKHVSTVSAFEAGQGQHLVDDIDVDEALEAAGSFLQTWNINSELKKASGSVASWSAKSTPVNC